MSLLYNVLFAWKTKNTHHKLALDALRHLQSPYAEQWSNLFLKNIEPYLKGSKAPDNDFKDFRNHVLHVGDNYWGGAIKTTLKWYKNTVDQLKEENWKEAIYCAGVLSHYYTDPIQPFHTGQSDAEGKVHRAAEWSIAKSYEILQLILEEDLGGYPDVKVPQGANWLSVMVKEGAEQAHPHYEFLVENYDLKTGRRRPQEGLNVESQKRIAGLIGHASVGFSRILDKAFEEADVIPPRTSISLHGMLATMTIPIFWVTKQMADVKEKAIVTAIYNEIKETGQLVENLPEDDREIKELYEKEVLKTSPVKEQAKPVSVTKETPPQKTEEVEQVASSTQPEPVITTPEKPVKQEMKKEIKTVSKKVPVSKNTEKFKNRKSLLKAKNKPIAKSPVNPPHEVKTPESESKQVTQPETKPATIQEKSTVPFGDQKSDLKFYLSLNEPVVEAPSIGAKTAKRLKKMKILTVSDLLEADPEETARKLNVWHIKAETIVDWQQQAELNCRIPNIRGHDVQILVACNYTKPEVISQKDPKELLDTITPFVESSEGQNMLRSCKEPDLEEVTNWVNWSKQSRPLKNAA